MPGLGATFGRGGATTAQWDLVNSQCIVIIGSSMAENHPVAFRFVMEARERGGKVVHVDPRFTRTTAMSDIYAPIRPGTDIAFVGGLINYIINSERWNTDPFFNEYVVNYTNAASLIEEDFQDTEDLEGLFSGWQEERHSYNVATWQYQGMMVPSPLAEHYDETSESFGDKVNILHEKPPPEDRTLQDPNCVMQIMRRHFARYTPEMVEQITGCPRDVFVNVAETLLENSGRERTCAFAYAVGLTQHTKGVQVIRSIAILQSLLGNVGRPGGGILALRGHCSIQGSTDVATLYNMLPGYLTQPSALKPHATFKDYLEIEGSPTGWWHNFPAYIVSLLRSWYGDSATPENDWGYHWLPQIMGDHSQLPMTLAMKDGTIRGLFLMGQNVVVGGQNSRLIREGLTNLEWLVVRDTAENESASFWYNAPAGFKGELPPHEIKTEVFLLPAALAGEKDGTFTNTQRLVQWHDKVVNPPGDCRSDLWFVFHLGRLLKEMYASSTETKDEPINHLCWEYRTEGPMDEPSADEVLREINGYTWPEKEQLPGIKALRDDGSTACGVWIYTGVYPSNDQNLSRSRIPDKPGGPGTHLGWAYAWPNNRRILFNRASADAQGRPWSEEKKYVWWDPQEGTWTGYDAIDFPEDKAPDYVPDFSEPKSGMDAIRGDAPFIMMADGRANLFAMTGLKDGPLPAHYEPVESPVVNLLYPQQENPAAKRWERHDNTYHAIGDAKYPYVVTTFRLTEHHTAGTPTRLVPSTAELQPEGFAEIPVQLARQKSISNLDWVVLSTARGEIETRALVTDRVRPLQVNGHTVYQIGLPWHFGWDGYSTGDIANVLAAIVADPNTSIHESKAFTAGLRKGRIHRDQQTIAAER